jgi:hypothetical protein
METQLIRCYPKEHYYWADLDEDGASPCPECHPICTMHPCRGDGAVIIDGDWWCKRHAEHPEDLTTTQELPAMTMGELIGGAR